MLSSLNAVKMTSGQYITDAILVTALQIRKTRNSANYSLKFRWTAGHTGIKGNEADTEAKKVAEGTSSTSKDLPPLLRKKIKLNKSALKQQKHSRLKAQWAQEWKLSPRYSKMACQEAALTRRTSWRRSRGGVGLGLSGKQLHPATPELTAWRERPADSSQ